MTTRRSILTALFAAPMAKLWPKSSIGPKPLMAHVSEIAEYPVPPMANFHDTHAQYMEWVKSPEYQNLSNEFGGWAKK